MNCKIIYTGQSRYRQVYQDFEGLINQVLNLTLKTHHAKFVELLNIYNTYQANNFGIQSRVESCVVELALVGNPRMKLLNEQLRGQAKSTNVLSLASYNWQLQKSIAVVKRNLKQQIFFPNSYQDKLLLGDIAIAIPYVKSEAKMQQKKINDHVAHLFLHGFLHLLGYDHMNDSEALVMESLEIELLEKVNIANPYRRI